MYLDAVSLWLSISVHLFLINFVLIILFCVFLTYYRPKRYCPVLVAQEGSALWGNTLTTALLHDLNRTIPFETIVQPSVLAMLDELTAQKSFWRNFLGNYWLKTALKSPQVTFADSFLWTETYPTWKSCSSESSHEKVVHFFCGEGVKESRSCR